MTSPPCLSTATIFMIEDDLRLAALVTRFLGEHGMHVAHHDDPVQAERLVRELQPPLVLLDIGLGSADGIELCRRLRPHYQGVLCIFSARADDMNQVVGLELGADDFITKPIEPRVLLARLRAHLRRCREDKPSTLAFGRLHIDLQERRVQLDDAPVALTTAEFDLLILLAGNAGQIMDRDALLRSLRRIGFDGLDRSIDTRISRLRRKLGDTGPEPVRIKTVRGQGYLFSAAGWSWTWPMTDQHASLSYARYGAGLIMAQLLLAWFGTLAWHHWTDQQYERYVRGQIRGTTSLLLDRLAHTPPAGWDGVMQSIQPHFAYPVVLHPLPKIAATLDARRAAKLTEGSIVVNADASYAYQRIPGTGTVIVFGDLDSVTEPTPTGSPSLLSAGLGLLCVVIIALAAPFYVLLYRLLRDMKALDAAVRDMLEISFHASGPQVRTRLLQPLAIALQHMAGQMRSLLDGQRLMSQAMAHELRTPLTRLRFSSELLETAGGAQRTSRALSEEMRADIEHLDELVRAGLEYARFGRMPLVERSTVGLLEMLRAVWKQLDKGDGPALVLDVGPERTAYANAPALGLALRNVMANARRHARRQVVVRAFDVGGMVRVEVHDDGPGIPEDMADRVFEPYVRLDTSTGGFGLGLAMVRSIVQKHDGDVGVTRSSQGGACLALRLPRPPEASAAAPQARGRRKQNTAPPSPSCSSTE